MMTRTSQDDIETLIKTIEGDGHCPTCHQTIKIYRYRLNRSHCLFLRAMAERVRETGINNVDIEMITAYSVRSQVTKLRFHGLIARVKNEQGKQMPRHWLITKKGWGFLKGDSIPAVVITFNNQVLGHDDMIANIFGILGELPDPNAYAETPITPPESKTYHDVRTSLKKFKAIALFKGHSIYNNGPKKDHIYDLSISKLTVGQPVNITIRETNQEMHYKDIAAFQKDWRTT